MAAGQVNINMPHLSKTILLALKIYVSQLAEFMKLNSRALVFLLAITVLLSLVPFINLSILMKSSADGTGDFPPPIQGDWTITQDTYVRNENITINGNITIKGGGKLTLDNVTLRINASDYGEAGIDVKNGGEFNIINNSLIMQGETLVNYDFFFENQSRGLIQNSTITDCGWNDGGTWQSTGGILIASDNVTIENSSIQNCYTGIVIFSSSPTIQNNLIQDNQKYGLFLFDGAANIIDNVIARNPVGIYSIYSNFNLSLNEIRDNGDGLRILYSNLNLQEDIVTSNSPDDCSTGTCSSTETGVGIHLEFCNLTVKGANISSNNKGLYAYYSNVDIKNSTLSDNSGNGIYGFYSEINIFNNIFSNNLEYGVYCRGEPLEFDDSNLFTYNNGVGRIIMEWEVYLNITDNYGYKVSNANVSFEGKDISYSITTSILGTATMGIADYEIFNDGTYYDYNPYNITVTKIAPWDNLEYSNFTVTEIRDNLIINMKIPLKKPDLKLENIDYSGNPRVGKQIKINIKISNIGDATANDVQIVVTQKDSRGKTKVVDKINVSVDPNESVTLPISWTPELDGETVISAEIKTNYDEINKDNNDLEDIIKVGEKERSIYEEPYFIAGLFSILIILIGVAIYILALRKNMGGEKAQ